MLTGMCNECNKCFIYFKLLTFFFFSRYGSITQSSTIRLGTGPHGEDVYIPMSEVLPMVKPEDLVIDGWDISSVNLAEAMVRARVLDWNLQQKLYAHLEKMRPRPSIYYPDFIAENQVHKHLYLLSYIREELNLSP